jgi:hypothetical protein
MTLPQVRLLAEAIAIGAIALALTAPQRRISALRNFFVEPSSPANLGALRAVVFWMILRSALQSDAVFFAGLPETLRALPPGWRWASGWLPFDPAFVADVRVVLIVSAACATLGLLTRFAAPIAALAAVYVLGIPNFYMKIDHGNHSVVLCALTLAFAPCGDALSLDRLLLRRRGQPPPSPAPTYTIPVRLCWLILSTVYLFPGFWKLWHSGDLWISGLKLQYEMRSKWAQLSGFQPIVRIDDSPFWTSVLGTGTLVFEIGFLFALFNRVTRVIAALSAVAFHLGIKYVMGIQFHAYFPLILLLDFPQLWHLLRRFVPAALARRIEAWATRIFAPPATPAAPVPSIWPATAVGTILIVVQLVTGFARIDTWPVAVHPLFDLRREKLPTTGGTTLLILEPRGGGSKQLNEDLQRIGSARLMRLLRKLRSAAHKGYAARSQGKMIVGLFGASGVTVAPGDHVAIYEAAWDLFPLGQHANYRQKLVDRYVVTDDLALAPAG